MKFADQIASRHFIYLKNYVVLILTSPPLSSNTWVIIYHNRFWITRCCFLCFYNVIMHTLYAPNDEANSCVLTAFLERCIITLNVCFFHCQHFWFCSYGNKVTTTHLDGIQSTPTSTLMSTQHNYLQNDNYICFTNRIKLIVAWTLSETFSDITDVALTANTEMIKAAS